VHQVVKRALDLVLGTALLVAVSPLLLVAAVMVRAGSCGPALFRQARPGKHGVPFAILKLRTMVDDARVGGGSASSEITPIGRCLRRLKIDELPQLINVLKGDMSLVGPRPVLDRDLEPYRHLAQPRLQVRPGLTGLAQVLGNNHLGWPQRLRLDAEYVRRRSIGLDLLILLRTVPVVLFGEEHGLRGNAGVSRNQIQRAHPLIP
jgi:lipopolysaccharide/colanic/teichoic acid biosynthesis glycosyltransferase